MTPPTDTDDINLSAKSDRELLIMLVGKVNHACHKIDKHDSVLFNSGWGLVAQNKVMWACFVTLGGIVIKLAIK